jgi:hypothetical protein
VNYTEVVMALTYYGLVHDDAAALAAADRAWGFVQKSAHASRQVQEPSS